MRICGRYLSVYAAPGRCLYIRFILSSFYITTTAKHAMDSKRPQDDDAFLREWTIPEEDRHKYTTQPWAGEYRWFRSPNVICLERYRALRQQDEAGE